MKGKAGHMTDIFLDRPSKAFMLLTSDTCTEMSNAEFKNHADDSGYTQLSFIEERALTPVVCYTSSAAASEATNDTLLGELGIGLTANRTVGQTLNLVETAQEMARLSAEGDDMVLLMVNATSLPQDLQDKMRELNLTVKVYNRADYPVLHEDEGSANPRPDNTNSWIDAVTGLKSTLRISEGLTHGSPVYSSVFEGGSPTVDEAKATAEKFHIWLTSGNLPIKVSVVLERPNLPELGQQFLKYAGFIALLAVILVACIIAIRYREYKVAFLISMTSFSEIVIILGFASLASWELDLAALAGIIAAIGTGVDHQIIITDETLHGEGKKKKEESKIWDINQAINRAFFIIFTSAATVVFAMLPIMSILDLKGFALTSIVGVLIGVLITRPAYARIIEIVTKTG
jgi:preprotein translocase subunit SecD